eukprot:gnl/MRDRNA2_/MRDRNA2_77399_c0_seq1.p1 gnl/MRDRNA2_/MRDRNA2_77399_c0~~gnl/MRDRNA2_/MRDRNA2_77399_c0_seq1.p1  ORF type:complete len:132 (+),score=15.77 gnl/MRDRNA2_/MRDRNA2_77399_c0_seq1:101-496(+)
MQSMSLHVASNQYYTACNTVKGIMFALCGLAGVCTLELIFADESIHDVQTSNSTSRGSIFLARENLPSVSNMALAKFNGTHAKETQEGVRVYTVHHSVESSFDIRMVILIIGVGALWWGISHFLQARIACT